VQNSQHAAQPDPRKPERGPGRPTQEAEGKTGHIHIRTTLRRKSAYVRAARGKALAEWMTEVCDRESGYAPQS
jgi:hypothetical protein